uniref:NADH-ubiquinone oxidoreductase chain 6 n=1 Tax=Tolypocladium guangdongense TaxID=2730933 RepID=A0A7S9A3A9_9HYPO|nr:NADH dehydrogenase subunit 6 [Tolypocladium guangdongense]QPF24435.1 NADH dehydrogenase subunit 6 [Tolypocladium guangdongense]
MNQLLAIYDILSNGYSVEYLDILSIIALLFGIAVIVNKNPIASLLSLIGLFASISVYLILSGLTFIGFSYLIVYIGAVSILFLFILMLINIRTSELQSNNWNSIPLALFVTIFLNYTMFQLLPYYVAIVNSYNSKISNLIYHLPTSKYNDIITHINKNTDINTTNVMFVTSNSWDVNMTETSHISTIGNILYTSYNMWLFIASIILLLAMTGAIIITIKQERNREINSIGGIFVLHTKC